MQEHIAKTLANGGYALTIETFWNPGCLAALRRAQEWWPKPAIVERTMHTCPLLSDMLRAVASMAQPHLTFMQVLELRWARCCAWLRLEGIDTEYPNETKEERRARKGREGVARHRARVKATLQAEGNEPVNEAKRLWGEYIAACQARKAAAQAAHDAHTPAVEAAKAAYEAAKL